MARRRVRRARHRRGRPVAGLIRWIDDDWSGRRRGDPPRARLAAVKETDIPIGRVQAIDTQQGPVQRLFGVQSVSVQTGGGGAGGEIVLDALGSAELARLRAAIAERRPEPRRRGARGGARAAARARAGVLTAALTSGQLGVILPALAGLGQMFQNVVSDTSEGEQAIRLLPDSAGELVLAAAGLLVLAWLLSVLGAIVAFAGFRVARESDRLRIRRGLVARREVTLPVARIRAVSVVEGVLRQPLGLATVRVEVIGYAKEPAAAQTLFPLLRRREVARPARRAAAGAGRPGSTGSPPRPRGRCAATCCAPALGGLAAGARRVPADRALAAARRARRRRLRVAALARRGLAARAEGGCAVSSRMLARRDGARPGRRARIARARPERAAAAGAAGRSRGRVRQAHHRARAPPRRRRRERRLGAPAR